MTYYVPCGFYPVTKLSPSHQKRLHKRIKRLVDKGMAEKRYHYRMPRRILVPLAALLSLLLIGCSAATPEVRETVVRTAEKVSAVIERILTREEQQIDPYAVPIDAACTNEESGVTVSVDKLIRDGTKTHMKLTFASPTAFDGYLLQFDNLTLAQNTDTEGKYKTTKKWANVLDLRWGEAGIMAGELLSLLEENQSSLSVWLVIDEETLPLTEYQLTLTRLFAADDIEDPTANTGSWFDCTEYGDFTINFQLTREIPVIPETDVTYNLPFTLDGDYFRENFTFTDGTNFPDGIPMVLESIHFHPLYMEVVLATEVTDKVCVLPGYEEYPVTPVEILQNLSRAAREYGLSDEDYRQFVGVGYKTLTAAFRDGVETNLVGSYSRSSRDSGIYYPPDQQPTKDTLTYHISLTEPIMPEDLLSLTIVPYDFGEPLVIWKAEE